MHFIGKFLLGALLLIFGLLTLGMGVCAVSFTAGTQGLSLLFGLPVTALLGFIALLIWRALQNNSDASRRAAEAPRHDDPAAP